MPPYDAEFLLSFDVADPEKPSLEDVVMVNVGAPMPAAEPVPCSLTDMRLDVTTAWPMPEHMAQSWCMRCKDTSGLLEGVDARRRAEAWMQGHVTA